MRGLFFSLREIRFAKGEASDLAGVLYLLVNLPLIALADTRYVYTKDGKSLNLRSTPKSNTGNKIGNIPYGTKIIVREYLDDGWAYVKYGKRFGYVMSKYLWEVKPLPKKTRTTRR